MAKQHVLIVGSGLAGGLLACMLARRGYRVSMHERRPDPRAAGFIGGRSINLALSCRGITALERVGLAEAVLSDAVPMPGRMMHSETAELTYQAYSKDPTDVINSVSRCALNITLLNAAEEAGAELHFATRCLDADLDAPAAIMHDEATGKEKRQECDVLIGADGAFSAVRGRMQKTDRFDYSQSYLSHGYKELTIPPAVECAVDPNKYDGFALHPNALHIWPRGGYMMIALPNADRSFTCTLFWPFKGPHSFEAISERNDVLPFFNGHFPDAVPLIPSLVDDFMTNPIGSLATIRCDPWHVQHRVVLLGDASHAIVPFYGQGINAGFEDCRVLDEMIEQHNGDFDAILPAFSEARKPHADAIADLALENFVEMRDRVADPAFLARKKIEHALHAIDPQRFTPQYNLVSFTNTPYAEAREEGARVIALAERILESVGVNETRKTASEALEQRVRTQLAESS